MVVNKRRNSSMHAASVGRIGQTTEVACTPWILDSVWKRSVLDDVEAAAQRFVIAGLAALCRVDIRHGVHGLRARNLVDEPIATRLLCFVIGRNLLVDEFQEGNASTAAWRKRRWRRVRPRKHVRTIEPAGGLVARIIVDTIVSICVASGPYDVPRGLERAVVVDAVVPKDDALAPFEAGVGNDDECTRARGAGGPGWVAGRQRRRDRWAWRNRRRGWRLERVARGAAVGVRFHLKAVSDGVGCNIVERRVGVAIAQIQVVNDFKLLDVTLVRRVAECVFVNGKNRPQLVSILRQPTP